MKICGPNFKGFKVCSTAGVSSVRLRCMMQDWLESSAASLRGESALLDPEEAAAELPFLSLGGDTRGYWQAGIF